MRMAQRMGAGLNTPLIGQEGRQNLWRPSHLRELGGPDVAIQSLKERLVARAGWTQGP